MPGQVVVAMTALSAKNPASPTRAASAISTANCLNRSKSDESGVGLGLVVGDGEGVGKGDGLIAGEDEGVGLAVGAGEGDRDTGASVGVGERLTEASSEELSHATIETVAAKRISIQRAGIISVYGTDN